MNNKGVLILKVAGMAMSAAGMVISGIASSKENKIMLAKMVAETYKHK